MAELTHVGRYERAFTQISSSHNPPPRKLPDERRRVEYLDAVIGAAAPWLEAHDDPTAHAWLVDAKLAKAS